MEKEITEIQAQNILVCSHGLKLMSLSVAVAIASAVFVAAAAAWGSG